MKQDIRITSEDGLRFRIFAKIIEEDGLERVYINDEFSTKHLSLNYFKSPNDSDLSNGTTCAVILNLPEWLLNL